MLSVRLSNLLLDLILEDFRAIRVTYGPFALIRFIGDPRPITKPTSLILILLDNLGITQVWKSACTFENASLLALSILSWICNVTLVSDLVKIGVIVWSVCVCDE